MISKLRKSTEDLLKSFPRDKKVIGKGTIIGTIIALSPYIYYSYEGIPNSKTWDTFLFTYHSNYFESANVAMWVLTGKIFPLFLLIIWFFTNRHWWYHAIIVPIFMYVYQIINFFYEDIYLDKFQLYYMVPVMCLIVPSIYLIRAKMFDKLNDAGKTMEELEAEFMIKPTTFWGKVRQYF